MTIEDKLKEYILRRYSSIREFYTTHDIPGSTVHSMFKRGINNSSIANVIKICKALGISVDALAEGELKPTDTQSALFLKDTVEISDVLDDAKELLSYNGTITLDGNPIDKSDLESILDAFDVGVEIAKRKNQS